MSTSEEFFMAERGGSEGKNVSFQPSRKKKHNKKFSTCVCDMCRITAMLCRPLDRATRSAQVVWRVTNAVSPSRLLPDGYSTIDQRDKDCKYKTSNASSDLTEREPLKVRSDTSLHTPNKNRSNFQVYVSHVSFLRWQDGKGLSGEIL